MPEAPAPEAPAEAAAPAPDDSQKPADETPVDFEQFPQDHPLVKTLKAQRAEMAELKSRYADHETLAEKAKRLDEIEEASKSELEKMIARAEAAEAKVQEAETQRQVTQWRDEVAEATGVPAAALRGSTKEEFEAHAETLKSLIPPTPGAAPAGKQGLEQRGAEKVSQLTEDDLKGMSPDQIVEAKKSGRLNDLLGIKTP